jgi:hypothetical protein
MSVNEKEILEMEAKINQMKEDLKKKAIVESKPKEMVDYTKNWTSEVKTKLFVKGDLSVLSEAELLDYYVAFCKNLGLNPITRPFALIQFKDSPRKELYAKKDATDQLRAINNININIVDRSKIDTMYVVTARATMPNGRQDESTGAVGIRGMDGDALGNACMKAETKAKRRVTLSIIGLGYMSEEEARDVPGATLYEMNTTPIAKIEQKTMSQPVQNKTIDVTPSAEPTPTQLEIVDAPILSNPFSKKKKTTVKAEVIKAQPPAVELPMTKDEAAAKAYMEALKSEMGGSDVENVENPEDDSVPIKK